MFRRTLILVFLIVIQCNCFIKVDPKTQFMVDEFGRVRIFHGVNAVYKIPPWIPQTEGFDPQFSLSSVDATIMRQWGFNAVRLGVMWPGVEIVNGVYNQTYLEIIQKIVDTLAKEGIYTILDLHQDLFNRKFCGEGIPDWMTFPSEDHLPFALPIAEKFSVDPITDYPDLQECLKRGFAIYYFSSQVGNAFQNLYDDRNGMQTKGLVGYWDQISRYFNQSKFVLGYELINEPWCGDIYREPELLIPGIADKRKLQPMYENLHGAIRKNDNEHIIFFEKALVDIVGPNGFSQGPGGADYRDRQVYSYHIYCAPSDSEGSPSNIVECDFVDTYFYHLVMNDLKRMGSGGFMTEFGAVPNTSIALESIRFLTQEADKHLQSWTYWQYKFYNDITTQSPGESLFNGDSPVENKVKSLARTYAQAIAGIPTYMHFDNETSRFELRMNVNTEITEPTVIYLSETYYYPHGIEVQLLPSGIAKWTKTEVNRVEVSLEASASNGQELLIVIVPSQ